MGIKLQIDDKNGITMPACFADSNLTVAEIGALFCFTAMSETGNGVPRFESADADFLEAAKGLQNKGILTFERDGRSIKMIFDYDAVESDPRFKIKKGKGAE